MMDEDDLPDFSGFAQNTEAPAYEAPDFSRWGASPAAPTFADIDPDDLDHLVAILNEPMPEVLARAARNPLQGHTEHRCPGCGHEWTGSCTPEP